MSRSRLRKEQERAKPKVKSSRGLSIEAIKDQVQMEDLIEYLGGTVPRLRSGWSKCRCPFHEDRNPSASVHPVEGKFHCFSCDVTGDVIDLAMHHLKTTDLKEAVTWLFETFQTTGR